MSAAWKNLIAGGVVLVAASAYPLTLIEREWRAGAQFAANFSIQPEYNENTEELNGHKIVVTDAFLKGQFKPEDQVSAPVKIFIDGKDVSDPSVVEIRPYYRGANRYHGWVVMTRLLDKKSGQKCIVVGERTLGDTLTGGKRAVQPGTEFRLLLVDANGTTKEERFSLDERASPLYREIFVRFLYPQSIGFYSSVLDVWPTLIYPILYPMVTGAGGFLMIAAGVGGRLLRAK